MQPKAKGTAGLLDLSLTPHRIRPVTFNSRSEESVRASNGSTQDFGEEADEMFQDAIGSHRNSVLRLE